MCLKVEKLPGCNINIMACDLTGFAIEAVEQEYLLPNKRKLSMAIGLLDLILVSLHSLENSLKKEGLTYETSAPFVENRKIKLGLPLKNKIYFKVLYY